MGSALGCRSEADSSVVTVLCQGPFPIHSAECHSHDIWPKFAFENPRTCGLRFSQSPPVHWLYRIVDCWFVRIVPIRSKKPAARLIASSPWIVQAPGPLI